MDKKMFLKLIDERKEVLYKMAYMYVKNQHDAIDILDETIYKAYSSLNKIREERYFNTYITRILINSSIDYIRKNKKIIYMEEILSEDDIQGFKEEKLDLFTAVDKLPPMEKTIIILKYFQDLKIKEISEI
ncbi:MAG: sigma-70 family RNA polymerase sigma factor, partial [Bacillota bacterium]|nr:sigma-70 family RNA polymerase sigma factor [Bacillota bacterium]